MKERIVDQRYDPLGHLIRTWRRRTGRESEAPFAALTFAIAAINTGNRLAVGLRTPVTSLDGLDLPAPPPTPADPS